MSSQTSRTLDLGLDFDSVARLANKPPDLQLHLVPLEKRIHAKILQLRRLRAHGDSLGDQQVLNDLVAIHQANASRLKHEADTRRHHLREARIIAGISDTTADPDRSNLVRRVSGKPIRHISGRTVSALKARTSAIRSASKNSRTSVEKRDERFQNRHHAPPGPSPGKPDMSRLSRKSSARLKRLGSAGSVLIRRLSKVSVSEDASSGSSADAPASSTFDQNTMKRLKMTPKEVIAEISAELKRLEDEERIEMAKLTESKKLLSERRGIHEKAMAILDQFYGSLPGWEDDPIAQRLFPETAEMTEAGLEAERDLVDARDTRERARAAYADHGRALNGLLAICTELNLFIEHLEQLLFYIDQCESSRRAARSPPQVSRDVGGTLRKLEAHLDKCVHNARLGVECCSDAPRLTQLQNDLENLSKGFAHEANAVITEGTIYHSDLGPTLQVAKAALCDCKLAETFVSERQRLISEDVESFENQVERCEEYVMLERIGILDMHHPPANDR